MSKTNTQSTTVVEVPVCSNCNTYLSEHDGCRFDRESPTKETKMCLNSKYNILISQITMPKSQQQSSFQK